MAVSKKEIMALAKLARLEFDDEQCEEFSGEFEEIIAFADRINSQVEGETSDIREVGGRQIEFGDLRADEVRESLPNEKILSNVEGEGGFFPVKRVVK